MLHEFLLIGDEESTKDKEPNDSYHPEDVILNGGSLVLWKQELSPGTASAGTTAGTLASWSDRHCSTTSTTSDF